VAALQAERSAAVGTAVSLEVKLADARREADRERAAVVDLRAALFAAEVRVMRSVGNTAAASNIRSDDCRHCGVQTCCI